jgi:hypothetical protein
LQTTVKKDKKMAINPVAQEKWLNPAGKRKG